MASEVSGATVPLFQVLAADVKELGIEVVFALVSDDTALFAATLDAMGVQLCAARHENTAIAMAEGYAYVTGKLGVALIGRGPALANGVHAAAACSRSGSPLLIIYGEASNAPQPNAFGPDYKAVDGVGIMREVGLRTFVATSPGAARAALADATASAMDGRAASLHLPVNVQFAQLPKPTEPLVVRSPSRAHGMPTARSIGVAVRVLSGARRPIFLAGRGAHRSGARRAIEDLAERSGGLLATTAGAKGFFRSNPFDLGIVGSFSHSIARRMIDQADCVVAFGAGLNLLTTSYGTALPDVPVIQVDAERAHIGRWLDAEIGIVGDAREVAEQLLAALPDPDPTLMPFRQDETRQLIAAFDPASDFQAANTARTLDPRTLALALDRMLPQDRNLVVDGGNVYGIVPFFGVSDPGGFKIPADFASIGLGFGAALGMARGRPDRATVLVIGDGSLLMVLGELETVIREDLPLVIVLMNDCAYGAELHYLKLRQQPVGTSVFPDVDFAPIAETLGFEVATVRTMADLDGLARQLAAPSGPILLDCKINADVAAPFLSERAHFEASH